MVQFVYKILTSDVWESVRDTETFNGAEIDLEDGFIHLSTAQQVPGTLARFFSGRDDLVLLEIDMMALGNSLKWEPAKGDELFPHLYGPLEIAAVRAVHPLRLRADGTHELPQLGE